MSYKHILAAIEIHKDSDVLLTRAQALAQIFNAKLSVITVVQYIPLEPMPDMAMTNNLELTNELMDVVKVKMTALCERFGLGQDAGHVRIGGAGSGILSTAEELGVDLLVIGHHPRTGFLSGLFGHTDKSVVGGASCDVLAVTLAGE